VEKLNRRVWHWVLYSLGVIWVLGVMAYAAETPLSNVQMQEKIQAAVQDEGNRLGLSEPYHLRLLQDEAYPLYSRFVRDYRQGANGLEVQVDRDGLKKYISFYAPTTLKGKGKIPKIIAYVLEDSHCEACLGQKLALERMIRMRAERRGLTLEWLKDSELPRVVPKGSAFQDWILGLAEARGVQGVWLAELKTGVDDGHGVVVPRLSSFVWMKSEQEAPYRFYGETDWNSSEESSDSSLGRLLSDAFTQFGDRAYLAMVEAQGGGTHEIRIEFKGVKDYHHQMKLREAVARVVGIEEENVQERRIARGIMAVGVRTPEDINAMKRKLASVPTSPEAGKWNVVSVTEEQIGVEVK
jgi:hypothetical protein